MLLLQGLPALDWRDYTVLGLFLAVTLSVGLWFSRRWKTGEDYYLAGRRLPWPLIGFSLFATNISAEHFVGLAAAGHRIGLVQGGYEWIASYCLIVLALVFAPQYLKHRVFTIPEFFEKRYGFEVRMALTVYFLAMIVLTKVSMAIFGGAKILEHLTGWNLQAIMFGIGIITALYTMAGGLSAVVYTDTIQALILIGGSAYLVTAALGEAGGWSGLETALDERNARDMLSMVRPPDDPELPFTGFLLGNFLIGGMFYWCMDQVNVQRVLGARDVRHARAGALFAGFLKILPVFLLTLPGVLAFVLYHDAIGEDHNSTYGVLLERLMAPGFRGLVLAALLAAMMSSLSSSFNSAATLAARDVLARLFPQSSLRLQLAIGNAALVTVMLFGIAATRFIETYADMWTYLQEITGYLSVPFAVAGLLGVFSRRVNRPGALAGILAGVGAGLFFFLDSKLELAGFLRAPVLQSFLHRHFLCGVVSAGVMLIASRLGKPPPETVTGGSFSIFGGSAGKEDTGPPRSIIGDHRLWAAILFLTVAYLWWTFR